MALSGDGNTLFVDASREDSNATGVNPGPAAEADDSASEAGAVYMFVRDGMGSWSQQAYLKASNTDASDYFGGSSVALSEVGWPRGIAPPRLPQIPACTISALGSSTYGFAA